MATNPFEQAALPTAIDVLKAVQTFVNSMGSDPMQWAVKFPGALTVLTGTVELQAPALAQAEAGALQGAANSKLSGWIKALEAKQTAS